MCERTTYVFVFILYNQICIVNLRIGGINEMDVPLIEFKNVSFRYDEEKPWVLEELSFKIAKHEWVAIIGHNGSGKSTIAKLINGLLFPQFGEIWIDGIQMTEDTIWDIREKIGMVFQNPDNQFVGTSVQDDVAFGMENRGFPREKMIARIEETLRDVGMTNYLLTEPHRLSGGQKQRIAIARALASDPKVLLADEPTGALDTKTSYEIMNLIQEINDEGKTILVVTHEEDIADMTKRIVHLRDGVIIDDSFVEQKRALDYV